MPYFSVKKLTTLVIVFSVCFSNFFFGLSLLLLPLDTAQAAPNFQINYQGKLTDTAGVAVADDTYNLSFKLCTDANCATSVWQESRCYQPTGNATSTCNNGGASDHRVQITDGLFSVMLGEVNSIAAVDFNQTLYLEVAVGGIADAPGTWETLYPRKILGTVPSAFEASNLGGKNETEFGTLAEDETVAGDWSFNGTINATTTNIDTLNVFGDSNLATTTITQKLYGSYNYASTTEELPFDFQSEFESGKEFFSQAFGGYVYAGLYGYATSTDFDNDGNINIAGILGVSNTIGVAGVSLNGGAGILGLNSEGNGSGGVFYNFAADGYGVQILNLGTENSVGLSVVSSGGRGLYVSTNNDDDYAIYAHGNNYFNGSVTSTVHTYLGTTAGLNGVYINNWSDIVSTFGWSTSSEQYFWNNTSTWAAYQSNFDTALIATSTWQGNLTVDGYVSSTNGLYTQGSGHLGTNLSVDGNATTTGSHHIGGDLTVTGTTTLNSLAEYAADRPTFSNNRQLVDKQYVDESVARIGTRFYMLDAADVSVATYKQTSITASDLATASVSASVNSATNTLIEEWISPAGMNWEKLESGVYDLNVFAARTAGNRTVNIYWQFYERKADNSEVLIATSNLSASVVAKEGFKIFATLSNDYIPDANSRLVGKVYFRTTGGTTNTTCVIYYQGDEDSHWQVPVNQEFLDSNYARLFFTNTFLAENIFTQPTRFTMINATTTNTDTLQVFGSATTTDRFYVGNQLSVATSTPWSSYELAVAGDGVFTGNLNVLGNATSSNFYAGTTLGLNGVYINNWSDIASTYGWSTSSEQYFWNNTSTWSGYDSNWARNYNATSTFGGNLTINGRATTTKGLNIGSGNPKNVDLNNGSLYVTGAAEFGTMIQIGRSYFIDPLATSLITNQPGLKSVSGYLATDMLLNNAPTSLVGDGYSWARLLLAPRSFSGPTSGSVPLFSGIALMPHDISSAGGTVSSTAQLYIEGPINAVVEDNNYAIFVDDGISRFDGAIGLSTSTPGGTYGEKLTVVGDYYQQGNATTTVSNYLGTTAGLNGVYINNWSDIASTYGWSTSSEQYFWNNTSTWAAYQSNFDTALIATSTWQGNLTVDGYVSSTNGLYTIGSGHYGNILTVDKKLGVGTTTPNYFFEIVGSETNTGASPDGGVFARFNGVGGTTNYKRVDINTDASSLDPQLSFSVLGSAKWTIGTEADSGRFSIRPTQGNFLSTDPFTVTASGKIGIGTSTPGGYFGEKLTVVGDYYQQGNATTSGNQYVAGHVGIAMNPRDDFSLTALGAIQAGGGYVSYYLGDDPFFSMGDIYNIVDMKYYYDEHIIAFEATNTDAIVDFEMHIRTPQIHATSTDFDNSTTTGHSYLGTTAGLNGVYINNWSDIVSTYGWSTSSEQYFWNNTTTWAAYQSNFDTALIATSTWQGNLTVDGYASSTNGLYTMGSGRFGSNLLIDGWATTSKNLTVLNSLATGGAIPNSTTTANFGGNIFIQGNASTTGRLTLGVGTNPSANATFWSNVGSNTYAGYFNGNLFVNGNATSSHFAASEICLSGDCKTAWPTGGGSAAWQATTTDSSGNALTGSWLTPTTTNANIYLPKKLKVSDKLDVAPNIDTMLSSIDLTDNPRAIYVLGQYLYVGVYGGAAEEFQIYDISDPADPIKISGVDISGSVYGAVRSIMVKGDIAFLTTGNASLLPDTTARFIAFNVSDPSNPTFIGGVNLSSVNIPTFDILGRYAYIGLTNEATDKAFQIVDISDPANMSVIYDSYNAGSGSAGFLKVKTYQEKYVYAAGEVSSAGYEGASQGLIVFDVSDPYNATTTGGYDPGYTDADNNVESFDISGHYLYLLAGASTTQEFQILDISSSTDPVYINGADIDASASYNKTIQVVGDYAFLGEAKGSAGTGKITIYNIADPENIYLVDVLSNLGPGDAFLQVAGRYLYVNDGDFIEIYEVGGLNTFAGQFGSIWSNQLHVQDNANFAGNVSFNNNAYLNNVLGVNSSTVNFLTDVNIASSIGQTGNLIFSELSANGSNYVGFKAPDNIDSNIVWTLPSTDGSGLSNFLTSDGAGNLNWEALPAIGATAFLTEISIISAPDDATAPAWSNQPASLTPMFGTTYASSTQQKINLSNFTQFRLVASQYGIANDGAYLRVCYSTTGFFESTACTPLENGGSTGDLTLSTTFSTTAGGLLNGEWVSITPNAKADIWIRIYGVGGDGSRDPGFQNLKIQLKGYTGSQWANGTGGNIYYEPGVGNIGIGLSSPTSTLTIAGTFDVFGNATTSGRMVIGTLTGPSNDLGKLWVSGDSYFNGNATTTGSGYFGTLGLNGQYINNWSEISSAYGWSTSSEQYFWNNTTSWAYFQRNFDSALIATSTWEGNLTVDGNATTTGDLAVASLYSHTDATYDLGKVDQRWSSAYLANGIFFGDTNAGTYAWEYWDGVDTLAFTVADPATQKIKFYSPVIIDGNATTTGNLEVYGLASVGTGVNSDAQLIVSTSTALADRTNMTALALENSFSGNDLASTMNAGQVITVSDSGKIGDAASGSLTNTLYGLKVDVSHTGETENDDGSWATNTGKDVYGVYASSVVSGAAIAGNSTRNNYASYNLASSTDEGDSHNFGTYGKATNGDTTYGVYGLAIDAGATNYGVYGLAIDDLNISTQNYGGYFMAVGSTTSQTNSGLYSRVTGRSQQANSGAQIIAQDAPYNIGVWSQTIVNTDNNMLNLGALFQAANSPTGNNIGLYSSFYDDYTRITTITGNYAAYFDGDVYTNGNATTSGNFNVNNVFDIKDGFVGIATTTPGGTYSEKLTVVGGSYFNGNATTTGNINVNNTLYVKDGKIGFNTSTPGGWHSSKFTFDGGSNQYIADFHSNNSNQAYFGIYNHNAAGSTILMVGDYNGYAGGLIYDNATDIFTLESFGNAAELNLKTDGEPITFDIGTGIEKMRLTSTGLSVAGITTSTGGLFVGNGKISGVDLSTNYGILSTSLKTGIGYGLYASSTAGSIAYGVYGKASGSISYGVYGEASNAGSLMNVGVYSDAQNAANANIAFYGAASDTGARGLWVSATGNNSYGVHSTASGDNAIGVYSEADGTNSVAGVFYGPLAVNTTTPTMPLHVVLGTGAGGHPNLQSTRDVAVFESNDNAAIHIMSPTLSALGFASQTTRHNGVISYDHALKVMYFINGAGTEDNPRNRFTMSASGFAFGTSTPENLGYFVINSTTPNFVGTDPIFAITTSTSNTDTLNTRFKVMPTGNVFADGTFTGGGADYAEYFATKDTDLSAGEVVCLDILNDNSVKRCAQKSDTNIIGVISSDPGFVGNYRDERENDNNYALVAMLGQISAKVSAENGEIRPGDALASASMPGYLMKATAGDSTVGVALEGLTAGEGIIKVLISRKNKSLTVEEIEQQVLENIAAMEIEDEVNLMVAQAIDGLDLDNEINDLLDPKLLLLDSKLTVTADSLQNQISASNLIIDQLQQAVDSLKLQTKDQSQSIADLGSLASSTANLVNILDQKVADLQATASLTTEFMTNASSTLISIQSQVDQLSQIINSQNTTTESLVVAETATGEFETLTVNQAATFYGDIYVYGEAGFEHKVTFKDDIEVLGKIYTSQDQAGTATIKAGATSTEIAFSKEYEVTPKITANLKGDATNPVFVNWLIASQTANGFRIVIASPQEVDISFDWIALGVKSKAPQVTSFWTQADSLTAGENLLLSIEASDEDTAIEDLTYSWSISGVTASFEGEGNEVTLATANDCVSEATQAKITVSISDGANTIIAERIITINPQAAEPPAEELPAEPAVENPPVEEPAAETPIIEEPAAISGCMDSAATNYNPEASTDDGSCAY